LELGKR